MIRSGYAMEEDITMMFADIRLFTTLSENLGSQNTFTFLNDYLKKVEPCIKENGGFVDKFVGDGIMALFDGEEAPAKAIRAAIKVQKTVAEFNAEHQDMEDIVLGIGIHSGPVIIGVLGSESRFGLDGHRRCRELGGQGGRADQAFSELGSGHGHGHGGHR